MEILFAWNSKRSRIFASAKNITVDDFETPLQVVDAVEELLKKLNDFSRGRHDSNDTSECVSNAFKIIKFSQNVFPIFRERGWEIKKWKKNPGWGFFHKKLGFFQVSDGLRGLYFKENPIITEDGFYNNGEKK